MDHFYLLDYLKKSGRVDEERIDLLKYELDQRIYYYGRHFKRPKERQLAWIGRFKYSTRYFLKDIYTLYLLAKTQTRPNKKTIISNAYFSVNDELRAEGWRVLRPINNLALGWPTVGNFRLWKEFSALSRKIRNGDFRTLLSENFSGQLESFRKHLTAYYRSANAAALIVPNDISFFEQLNIQIFKELGRPSFIFLHGLPCRYNIYDENQTDYLVVWGKKFKDNYIRAGFNPDKILIAGHPYYKILANQPLRNSREDILIISKSLNSVPYRDGVRLNDRGNLIIYLEQIASVLKALGVKKVRLRVHPSENINWYFKFIDQSFFNVDKEPLENSLKKSTLVIGSTSTVFLEAIYYGVNYLVYEPIANNIDLSGYPPAPPFDGSDEKVSIARNEADLKRMLEEKTIVDKTIFNDYIDTPFNVQGLIDRI